MLSLHDERQTKPTVLERVTLGGLIATFGVGTIVLVVLNLFWMFLGFRYFTAKESDVPWYYPTADALAALLFLCGGALILTCVVSAIRRAQDRDHS